MLRSPRLPLLFASACAVAACSQTPTAGRQALLAAITFEDGATSQCARLVVTPKTGAVGLSNVLEKKDKLNIAVYRADDWSEEATFVARGYASCDAAAASPDVFTEESDPVTRSFPAGDPETLTLVIRKKPVTNEVCGDGIDNNGDGLVDCADPQCLNTACDDSSACTASDVCVTDGGCEGTPVVVDCSVAPTLCGMAPGTCNPADGGCRFAPVNTGAPCDDNNVCTADTECQLDGHCGGGIPAVTCNAPPGNAACYASPGTCNPQDGGCSYAFTTNPCDDGVNCTVNDVCANGVCAGQPKVCFQNRQCWLDAGMCIEADGGCEFDTEPNGTSCDDGNGCTQTDQCNNGACIGSSPKSCLPQNACQGLGSCDSTTGDCTNPTCPPRNECETAGTCLGLVCGSYTPTNNGGLCNSGSGICDAGTCEQRFTPFDSTTPASNFNPDAGVPRYDDLLINCNSTFHTGSDTAAATLTLCDGGTLTSAGNGAIEIAPQTNGPDVALLRVTGLTVGPGVTLTVNGRRPLILAVYGDAVIAGVIDGSAKGADRGPGADPASGSSVCAGGGRGGQGTGEAGGGGGGGAFRASGGKGGDGDHSGSPGGAAGTASGNNILSPLRGGCSGGRGGHGELTSTEGGLGGGGGGAVQVTASKGLVVSGRINVNGGGGRGGSGGGKGAGGGGGGSGGAILLESKLVTIKSTARVYANGAPGGEGGYLNNYTGQSSSDGVIAFGRTPGNDGAAGDNGNPGDGGGGANTTLFGEAGFNNSDSNRGAGGGGASTGGIRINFGTMCREASYEFSPSTQAPNGGTNNAFTSNAALPGTSTCN